VESFLFIFFFLEPRFLSLHLWPGGLGNSFHLFWVAASFFPSSTRRNSLSSRTRSFPSWSPVGPPFLRGFAVNQRRPVGSFFFSHFSGAVFLLEPFFSPPFQPCWEADAPSRPCPVENQFGNFFRVFGRRTGAFSSFSYERYNGFSSFSLLQGHPLCSSVPIGVFETRPFFF